VSDRPADRAVPTRARASARKRAYRDDGTNDGTNTERGISAQQPALSDEEREAIRKVGTEDARRSRSGTDCRSGWRTRQRWPSSPRSFLSHDVPVLGVRLVRIGVDAGIPEPPLPPFRRRPLRPSRSWTRALLTALSRRALTDRTRCRRERKVAGQRRRPATGSAARAGKPISPRRWPLPTTNHRRRTSTAGLSRASRGSTPAARRSEQPDRTTTRRMSHVSTGRESDIRNCRDLERSRKAAEVADLA
jgi:hypothetical protein